MTAKVSRPIPSGGKAFIEFHESTQASTAKDALQGFKVTPERPIKLSFAKNWKKKERKKANSTIGKIQFPIFISTFFKIPFLAQIFSSLPYP